MPKGSTSKSQSEPNHSSLSSIVSHLVRSQLGSTSSNSTPLDQVPDSELDRHVADLLLAEARSKDKEWNNSGVRAYYDQQKESTAPLRKPNTRFLSSMLKNVDDHNAALRRQEAEQQRKRERQEREEAEEWRKSQTKGKGKGKEREEDEERDRKRRRRRREELGLSASEDEGDSRRRREGSSRRSQEEREERPSTSTSKESERSSSRREEKDSSRKSRDDRSASPQSARRRKRTEEDDPREASRRDRHESSRSHRRRHRSRSRDGEEEEDSDRRRSRRRREDDDDRGRREEGREPQRSSTSSKEKGKRKERDQDMEQDERPLEEVFADVEKQVSKEPKRSRDSTSVPLPSSLPPPAPNAPLPSKMDKYFSPTYDPLLDFTPSQLTDSQTGLIGEGGFDEWDRMLSSLKRRKEDKKEVEWREKEERRREREKKRRERRRKRGEDVSESESDDEGKRGVGGQKGIMDMKYSKKGSTREWDLGKENPT